MRMPSLILNAVAIVTLLSTANAQDQANPPIKARAESVTKIGQLQNEQIETLKLMVQECELLTKSNRVEISELLDARIALLDAELDQTQKGSERVGLYTKALLALSEYGEIAKKQYEASRGSPLNMLKIKAKRLQIEILLRQAQLKEAELNR